MPNRVSVDRQEFQAFLAENQELVERYQKVLDKLGSLRMLNTELEEKLRRADQRLGLLEQKAGVAVEQGDEILRKARTTMARLMEETERHLSE